MLIRVWLSEVSGPICPTDQSAPPSVHAVTFLTTLFLKCSLCKTQKRAYLVTIYFNIATTKQDGRRLLVVTCKIFLQLAVAFKNQFK